MNIIITIVLTAFIVLYTGLYKAKKALLPLSLIGLGVAMGFAITGWNKNINNYDMMLMDNYAIAFTVLILTGSFLIFLLSKNYFTNSDYLAEYFTLMLFALVGMVMMVSYLNLSMLFVGLEIMSVSLYILAGIRKRDFGSNEASLKYFLMGAFSTGFLLFGITLIYGATGSFDIKVIEQYLINNPTSVSTLFYPGIILMLIGMCFKIGVVPFHFWTPDVYEGSPTMITAFMATVVKAAGFAALLKLFGNTFAPLHDFWLPALLVIVILTLFTANITALFQKNFKRMLGWSSISHAGYLLFSLIVLSSSSNNSVLLYATAYIAASLVAFAILILVKQNLGSDSFESFNGLAKKNPLLALTLTIAMLSFAGIPLTAGFIGKYVMFVNVMNEYHTLLVVVAIVNALIGFYYYFKVIIAVYFKEGKEVVIPISLAYKAIIVLGVIITLVIGIYPSVILNIL